MSLWFALHGAATLFMTGLIWFVQVVHYPLMRRVGSTDFTTYEAAHVRRTGWVVIPPMLLEAATALALLAGIDGSAPPQFALSVLVLAAIWLTTFTLSAPCHRRLASAWDSAVHKRLVRSNWIRTIGWSLRSAHLIWYAVSTIPPPMKRLILIGSVLVLASAGMFSLYALSLDHSPGATSSSAKPLVPALPLLGPCLMGLSLITLGLLGLYKQKNKS